MGILSRLFRRNLAKAEQLPLSSFTASVAPLPPKPVAEDLDTFPPTLAGVLARMKSAGHKVFENSSSPFNLNIVGVRARNPEVNQFRCWITVFYKDPKTDKFVYYAWPATTLPGKYFLQNLLNPKGCAILVPGQYPSYTLDFHRGQYLALCQRRGPVTVYRDGDKDNEFDYEPSTKTTGWYGINIHRALPEGVTALVNRFSAGCQVFQNAADFKEFMLLCSRAKYHWGNKFTYTLVER